MLPSIFHYFKYISPPLTTCCIFLPEKILPQIFTLTPSKMDNLHSHCSSCETFTAEQLRKFLSLNDDYSNSSSSSSSYCEPDISHISSDISASQSDSKEIIPPSPKRITRSPGTLCRAVFLFLCNLNVVVIFYYIFL